MCVYRKSSAAIARAVLLYCTDLRRPPCHPLQPFPAPAADQSQNPPRRCPRRLHRRPQLHGLARPRPRRHRSLHPADAADDHLAALPPHRPLPRRRPPLPVYARKLGFAGADEAQRYSLRPKMLTLANTYTASSTLANAAQPILERMSAPTTRASPSPRSTARDRLHRPHQRHPRHVGRPPHRLAPPGLLHQHGPRPARLPPAGPARDLPLAASSSPNTPRAPSTPPTSSASPSATSAATATRWSTRSTKSASAPSPSLSTPRNGRVVATVNLSGHAPRIPMLEMQTRFLPPLRAAAAELSVFLR